MERLETEELDHHAGGMMADRARAEDDGGGEEERRKLRHGNLPLNCPGGAKIGGAPKTRSTTLKSATDKRKKTPADHREAYRQAAPAGERREPLAFFARNPGARLRKPLFFIRWWRLRPPPASRAVGVTAPPYLAGWGGGLKGIP